MTRLLCMLVACAFCNVSSFQYTTRDCTTLQRVGGGLLAPGSCQTVTHVFHAPHSVGGGMMHGAGWEHRRIVAENPWRQPIINLFAGIASGYEERQRWNRF